MRAALKHIRLLGITAEWAAGMADIAAMEGTVDMAGTVDIADMPGMDGEGIRASPCLCQTSSAKKPPW